MLRLRFGRRSVIRTFGSVSLLIGVLLALPGAAQEQRAEMTGQSPAICMTCHNAEVINVIAESPHHGEINCEDCHGPGSLHVGRTGARKRAPMIAFTLDSPFAAPAEVRNGQCLNCHRDSEGMANWEGSRHGKLICGQCHSGHSATEPMREKAGQDERCFGCHQDAQEKHPQFTGAGITTEHLRALKCWTCHDVHQLQAEAD